MLKYVGCFLIYSAFYAVSVFILKYREHIAKEYETYLFVLSDMQNTLRLNPVELSELLMRFADERFYPFNEAFSQISARLRRSEAELLTIWLEEFEKQKGILGGKAAQMDYYRETAAAFLTGSRGAIADRLEIISEALSAEIVKMNNEKKDIYRMYSKLAKMVGLMAVILVF